MLESYERRSNFSDIIRFQYDQRILAQATLARLLWLKGKFAEAIAEVKHLYAEAEALDHATTISNAIVDAAFPLALLQGDLRLADAYCSRLRQLTDSYGLDIWGHYAQCFNGQLLVSTNRGEEGVAELQAGISKLEKARFIVYRSGLISSLAEGLSIIGRHDAALQTADKGITHCTSTGEEWCLPELLRVRGAILINMNAADEAELNFSESLRIARQQGAIAWELRTAETFGSHLNGSGRLDEAEQLLKSARRKLPGSSV